MFSYHVFENIDIIAVMTVWKNNFGFHSNQKTQEHKHQLNNLYFKYQVCKMRLRHLNTFLQFRLLFHEPHCRYYKGFVNFNWISIGFQLDFNWISIWCYINMIFMIHEMTGENAKKDIYLDIPVLHGHFLQSQAYIYKSKIRWYYYILHQHDRDCRRIHQHLYTELHHLWILFCIDNCNCLYYLSNLHLCDKDLLHTHQYQHMWCFHHMLQFDWNLQDNCNRFLRFLNQSVHHHMCSCIQAQCLSM